MLELSLPTSQSLCRVNSQECNCQVESPARFVAGTARLPWGGLLQPGPSPAAPSEGLNRTQLSQGEQINGQLPPALGARDPPNSLWAHKIIVAKIKVGACFLT